MEAAQFVALLAVFVSVISVAVTFGISRRARRTQLDVERLKFDLVQRQAQSELLVALSSKLETFHIVLFQLGRHLANLEEEPRVTPEVLSLKLNEVNEAYRALTAAWAGCKPRLTKLALRDYGVRMHGTGSHTNTLFMQVELLLAPDERFGKPEIEPLLRDLLPRVVRETEELDRLIRSELGFILVPARYDSKP